MTFCGQQSCIPDLRCVASQGVDGWDVDLPTYLEANYVCTTLTKTLWVLVYIAVYGLRPIIIRPKKAGEILLPW